MSSNQGITPNSIHMLPAISKLRTWLQCAVLVLFFAGSGAVRAQSNTVCAEVRIEIAQELTIERQAFEAKLQIENTLADKSIENINVVVEFTDELGETVLATSDPNDTSAKFFIRVDVLDGINDISGSGSLGAGESATATWLIIPAPGASEGVPSGTLYFVGAEFNYTLDGIEDLIEVAPDSIYVRPMPLLSLDYFLPRDVFADDPLTQEVEAIEPFTLGVRVTNNGTGTGRSIKIESAQPEIVDNDQGLLIDFRLLNSYVQDAEVNNSLLIDFGDIASNASKMGRWNMTTSLSGRFSEFTAEFTHADELGGALTSLLEDVDTHFLLRDVLVDAPGRDTVKDFLSYEVYDALTGGPNGIKVFESDSTTTDVTNESPFASLGNASGTQNAYPLTFSPTAGFAYAQVADPFEGDKVITRALRSDGKVLNLNNVWFSKIYNRTTQQTSHYLNLFDFNTTGEYTVFLNDPVVVPRAPIWQSVPLRSTFEAEPLSFVVQATDPDGTIPVLTAQNLPSGASFTDNGNGFATFQWTPAIGQRGQYTVLLTASDGVLQSTLEMYVTVNSAGDTDGDGMLDAWEIENFGDLSRDGTEDADNDGVSDLDEFLNGTDPNVVDGPLAPTIVSPTLEAVITTLVPEIVIDNSEYNGPLDVTYVLEVFDSDSYAPENLVTAYYSQPQGADGTTTWQVSATLNEDATYYWRVRAGNSFTYSPWVNSEFTVNSVNQLPTMPVVSYPLDGAQVNATGLSLSVMNATDADGDSLLYRFRVYSDSAGALLVAESDLIAEQAMGTTVWSLPVPLSQGEVYYWSVDVVDSSNTAVSAPLSSFSVAVVNEAPSAPTTASPAMGERIGSNQPTLVVNDAVDDTDALNLSYLFEVSSVNTFDSGAELTSDWLQDSGNTPTFSWAVPQTLSEDTVYFWRVKARDEQNLESPWATSEFRVNVTNQAPTVPVVNNPGNESQVITLTPKLEVFAATDGDADTIEYEFELFDDPDLQSAIVSMRVGVSELMLDELQDDRWYYWRARAIDENELASQWSEVSRFFVNENNVDNPPEFIWLVPEAGTTITAGDSVILRWSDEDPDSSAMISIFYADNAAGTGRLEISEAIAEDDDLEFDTLSWSSQGLPPGEYFFFAVIDDGFTSVGVEAESVFTITVESGPIVAAELTSPVIGTILDSSEVTFTWNNTQADQYVLSVGSSQGASDYVSQTVMQGEPLSVVVTDLPINQSVVYVRLETIKGQDSLYESYQFNTQSVVNFNQNAPVQYGGDSQVGVGTSTVLNGGASLQLQGNIWQAVEYPYTITPQTVIEFDFSSTSEGEIHAIGFDRDLKVDEPRSFKMYGVQNWGILDFDNYAGDGSTQRYIIPVGNYYTGDFDYLFFAMDDDENSNGHSIFSNIRVYESGAPAITSSPVAQASVDQEYRYTVSSNGADPITLSLVSGPSGMMFDGNDLVWVPALDQLGDHDVSIRATNAAGFDEQVFVVSVVEQSDGVVVDFSLTPPSSFGVDQDQIDTGDATVLDDGATLALSGNRWQKIDLNYTVTANTMIEFDFSSSAEGEVHAIGFDTNLQASRELSFKVYGSQNWGIRDFDTYSGGGSAQRYVIPAGEFFTGDFNYLVFATDDDANSNAQSTFSNIRIYELGGPAITSSPVVQASVDQEYRYTVSSNGAAPITLSVESGPSGMMFDGNDLVWVPALDQVGDHNVSIRATNAAGFDEQVFVVSVVEQSDGVIVDFSLTPPSSFGIDQDQIGTGDAAVLDGGATLELSGNRWQKIDLNYAVTANTMIEFDFSSSSEGEVHAIGFDTNLQVSREFTFKVYGSQNWGIRDFDNYSGDGSAQRFVIPAGEFFTGDFNYLIFAADDDANSNAQSSFSNIRIYEALGGS